MDGDRSVCCGRELGVGCDSRGVDERKVTALTAVPEITLLLYFPGDVEVLPWVWW